jgi:Protein of unknown function (DUF5818)
MRLASFVVAAALLTAAAPPTPSKTYTGVVTDTMCSRDHKAMKIAPDSKCVRDCVGDGRTYQYALLTADGIYTLSDQETPAKFAAQRVQVTGVLYGKTKILKVESIKPAK